MSELTSAGAILKLLATAQDHITNHFENFKKKGSAKMTRELAETRIERLKELWKQFLANDEALKNAPDVDLSDEYFSQDVLYDMQETFDDVYDMYVQFLKTQPAAPQAQSVAVVSGPAETSTHDDAAGIPTILKYFPQTILPTFSGKISEWPHFRDMFLSIIHKQPAPSIMKLNCLHSHLTGDALDVIKNIAISEYNYELSWDTLKLHFENPRRLVQTHLSEIFAVKPMTNETSAEVKRILNQIFTPLDALTTLGRPTKQWSDIIVFTLGKFMSQDTRREWERNLGRSTNPPTLDRMKSFLQSQSLIFEAMEDSSNPVPNATSTPKKSSTSSSLQTSANTTIKREKKRKEDSRNCYVCGENHSLNKCPVFKNKPLAEKRLIINEHKLCANCLGPHNINNCASKFTCSLCKAKHHTLLHNPKKDCVALQTSFQSQPANINQKPAAMQNPM